ncbi:hypothetical protein MIND_01226300 [Mycena indigotica]|uniref:Aprataxin and PNK-like factor PBZ domain-containing protein n=1 Tax=Mycena indigotica TaxID=2126181 RepID=A0A8H6VU44_9AGAR|nr:uncharacterized protein MIND_01226300 [Mycena indigotica]KAF7292006.1 hypothetical protein MIND_01226300 [Mycena indigotica]
MTRANSVPLTGDIWYHIMIHLHTLPSLQATLLTSRLFYTVFQAHRNSIMRAVASNMLGEHLPEAWRVVCCRHYDHTRPEAESDLKSIAFEDIHNGVTNMSNLNALHKNTQVVRKLEDLYSHMYDDRNSPISVLSPDESFRFQRALYRIFLYCKVFPGHLFKADDIAGQSDEVVAKIRNKRQTLLDVYSTEALYQIYSVVKFLGHIIERYCAEQMREPLLSTGPAGILRIWQAYSCEAVESEFDFELFHFWQENPVFEGYFSLPLENIWKKRGDPEYEQFAVPSTHILDNIVSKDATCPWCGYKAGLRMLNATNWTRLFVPIPTLLKSNLKRNPIAQEDVTSFTANVINSDAFGPFIVHLFSFTTHTAPEFDKWKSTDSYCFSCLLRFLEAHLWVWLLEEKLKAGWITPENCWYGWDCRTQTNRSHAERRNHFCAPTKGDSVGKLE